MQAFAGTLCCTDIGANRNVHADIAGNAGKNRAKQEAGCGNGTQKYEDQNRDDNADHGDRTILAVQIGLCAFLDSAGNGLHFFVASRCIEHLAAGYEAV